MLFETVVFIAYFRLLNLMMLAINAFYCRDYKLRFLYELMFDDKFLHFSIISVCLLLLSGCGL